MEATPDLDPVPMYCVPTCGLYGFIPTGATTEVFEPTSSNARRTRPDDIASSMSVRTYASAAGFSLGTATAMVVFASALFSRVNSTASAGPATAVWIAFGEAVETPN